jgi:hypothetical protein
MSLSARKWFDRMAPQTLQLAILLGYLDGAFALLEILDSSGPLAWVRFRVPFGIALAFLVPIAHAAGGFLMANERRIGWKVAVAASFSPFVVNFVAYGDVGAGLRRQVFGGSIISFAFDVALVALLLHPQSRAHQKMWYR